LLGVDKLWIVMNGQRTEGRYEVGDAGKIPGIACSIDDAVEAHYAGVQGRVDTVTELDRPGAVT